MIRGTISAAVEYGTYVVTIPISETNNPEDTNWLQFKHLRKDNRVIFSWLVLERLNLITQFDISICPECYKILRFRLFNIITICHHKNK